MSIWEPIAGKIAGLIPGLLIGFGPLTFVFYRLAQNRKRYDEKAIDPFTEMPLRPPGESTRLKLESIEQQYLDHGIGLVAVSALSAAILCVTTS